MDFGSLDGGVDGEGEAVGLGGEDMETIELEVSVVDGLLGYGWNDTEESEM